MSERRPWVTYALIAANLVMFGVELVAGADLIDPTPQQLLAVGADVAPFTTDGEWWRLVTAMFLHFGLLHIAANMVCLYQARVVELLFGRAPFAVIYLLAGIVGGIASMARHPLTVSAGASGAVFGIFGAFGGFLVVRRSSMPQDVWRRTSKGMLMFVAINAAIGLSVPRIDLTGHIGGLVVGFLIGIAFLWRTSGDQPSRGRTLMVAGIGLAVAIASTFAIPHTSRLGYDVVLALPLLERIERVETACIDKVNEIKSRERAGQIDDANMAMELERDVLVPWRAMRSELVGAAVSGWMRPWFDAVKTYVALREESWNTLVAALHATGDDKKAKLALHVLQEQAVQRAANVVKAESKRLDALMH
jgi:rhomboid protease GluP